MKPSSLFRPFVAWLVLAFVAGVGAQGTQVDVSPALERLTGRSVGLDERTATPSEKIPPHEAIVAPDGGRKSEPTDKAPPLKIVERPGEMAPNPDAQWIQGYWDWDRARKDFDWVTGTWRVPPPGKFWVDGYWRHDENGWSRVPGFWSERRTTPTAATTAGAGAGGAGGPQVWSSTGPPAARPAETVGVAPGPDFFFIPGEYVPQGETIVWKPGFWYRSQPGWEWNPARWVRQASGWVFREGSWSRVVDTPGDTPAPGTDPAVQEATIVSRPAAAGAPPNEMDRNPASYNGTATPYGSPSNASAGGPLRPPGTTRPIGSIGNVNVDALPTLRPPSADIPAATPPRGQAAGTTPAGGPSPLPSQAPVAAGYGPRPIYNYPYPGGGVPPAYTYPPGRMPPNSNYYPRGGIQWDGRSPIGRFLNRFLPY